MKDLIKKNFIIILAFLLPVALIVIIALSLYLPSLFLKTDYNFVYIACNSGTSCDDSSKQGYIVENNSLVQVDYNPSYTDRIFLHDTKKNEGREITLAEAKALTLNSSRTSPDDVTVSSHRSGAGDFFPFGGSSSFGYYLRKGNSKSKINLIDYQFHYRYHFQFLGWVVPGRNS